jgi:uncharacterized protein
VTLALLLLLLAGGYAAGVFGALLGLGGGVLVVPLLVLLVKVPMHQAVAASLLCVIATSSAAASKNVRLGIANVRLGMTLELFTVAGGIAGGLIAGVLPGQALMIVFAVAITAMAVPMARGTAGGAVELPEDPDRNSGGFAASLGSSYYDAAAKCDVSYVPRRMPLAVSISSFAGVLSGLLGIGGGLVKVPILTLYCGVPMKASAATSNFVIGVTAVAGAWIYYGRGDVSPAISAATVIGVFAGSRTGSIIATKIGGETLRRIFAVVMVLLAIQLVMKAAGVFPS